MSMAARSPLTLEERHKDMLKSLAKSESPREISRSLGVSTRAIEGVLRSVKILIEANDSAVDDFLDLVEGWDGGGETLFFSELADGEGDQVGHLIEKMSTECNSKDDVEARKQTILDQIEADWSPQEMRELGASLIRLADALDQGWSPENVQSSFHWPSAAAQIERNSLELARRAVLLKQQIKMRKQFLPNANLGEPTWNMLLDLFCQFAGGAKVSTKSLCISADCPETSALRYIAEMEEHGLVTRSRSNADRRVTMVELTKKGVVSVGRVLERIVA